MSSSPPSWKFRELSKRDFFEKYENLQKTNSKLFLYVGEVKIPGLGWKPCSLSSLERKPTHLIFRDGNCMGLSLFQSFKREE